MLQITQQVNHAYWCMFTPNEAFQPPTQEHYHSGQIPANYQVLGRTGAARARALAAGGRSLAAPDTGADQPRVGSVSEQSITSHRLCLLAEPSRGLLAATTSRRGVFHAVSDLAHKIMTYILLYNRNAQPFRLTCRNSKSKRIRVVSSSVTQH